MSRNNRANNGSKCVSRVWESADYSLFHFHDRNRGVTSSSELERSMVDHGFLVDCPITVVANPNGTFTIKDGHRRFSSARKLHLPVKYHVCPQNNMTIQELQKTTKLWTLEDYLESHLKDDNRNYICVADFRARTGIALGASISLCAGQDAASHNKDSAFKDGTYSIGNMHHANTVARVVRLAHEAKVGFARTTSFVRAISKITWVPEFDVKRMGNKFKSHLQTMERQPNVQAYIAMLEGVYNRNAPKAHKLPLAFLANQAMADRSAIQTAK